MGSHISCMSAAAYNRQQSTASDHECILKFLNCETGAVSELEGPLIAAEAMMEFSAHFLCCFSSAVLSGTSGRRICAVPADEELQAAELYLLLPMHRLNKRFSVEELRTFAMLEAARKSGGRKQAMKGAISQSKVTPFPAPTSSADVMQSTIAGGALEILRTRSFKGLEGSSLNEGPMIGGSAKQVAMCRSKSWMPKLETVNEYAVVS